MLAKSWCDAGIRLIQIRAKNLSDLNYWVFAETIRDVCLPFDVIVIINGRFDIALGLNLDGVHITSTGLPIREIRARVPNMLIFNSCHLADEIEYEDLDLPDAITLSPVFSPLSKPHDTRPLIGLDKFKNLANSFPGKMYALGGIDDSNLAQVKDIPIASLGYLCHRDAYANAKQLLSRGSS